MAALLALIAWSGWASFPVVLRILNTPNPQFDARFGTALAMGDVDGDGRADLLIGVENEDVDANVNQGRAYLFSGATGALLRTLDSPNPQGDGYFGGAVATGDIDGDGQADMLVGAYREDVGPNANQGRAYVFSGATGTLLYTLDSPNPQATAYFGSSLAAGDADGDRQEDILVGSDLEDVGEAFQGRAYVFSGATGAPLHTLDTPNPEFDGRFGISVAMGDGDGDGRADMLVGAFREDFGANVDQGRAYLFSGASGTLLHTLDTPNPEANVNFGESVAMGDWNGDGRDEALVGAPSQDVNPFGPEGADLGRGYLFSGTTGAVVRTVDTPNRGNGAQFGRAVAMGDADGDGREDIAVGAFTETVGANADQGRAYLFTAAGAVIVLDSPNPQDSALFGSVVAMGDANGDGGADVLAGAPREDVGANDNEGRAYLFSGAVGQVLRVLDTPNPQDGGQFGSAAAMGDVDGDGRADMLVGAHPEDVGANANQGRAYLYSGASGGLLRTLDSPNPENSGLFGLSLAMGDVDLDGHADMLVGAPSETTVSNDEGRAYVFSGATGGILHTLESPNPQSYAFFGGAVAMGDADGDGRADMLVGAPREDVDTNENQGRVYLFSGATGTLLRTLDTPNPENLGNFGLALAMGDVDGDGRADMLVGALGEDVDSTSGAGRAYLFSGATGSRLRTLVSPNPEVDGFFGETVAMGDADGDGRADTLVGATNEDLGDPVDAGRAYLFSGASGALLHTLDTPNPELNAFFARSLAMGDVDGDGRAEVLVGARGEDVGTNSGRAYLFSGTTGALLETLEGPAPLTFAFGKSLAMGDANGDFGADILMGAPTAVVDGIGAGRAYLFFADRDDDARPDAQDNCKEEYNPEQGDFDGDGVGDACDPDCTSYPEDVDGYKDGDGCPDPDNDGDGFPDVADDCPGTDWTAGPDGIADTGDEPLNELSVPIQTKEDYDGVLDIDGCHDSPGDDYDDDGWTDEEEALEIGTNPALACPLTAIADDEEPDPWPRDFNDDRFINITDVFWVLPPFFGSGVGDPHYSPRRDLHPDGFINITDVFKVLPPFFGQSCTP